MPPLVHGATAGNRNDVNGKSIARAAIISCINETSVPMVAAEREMSADVHVSICAASVHTLRNKFLNLRMRQDTTTHELLNGIFTIERRFPFARKVTDNGDKKYALLSGLSKDYTIKSTI